MIAAITVKTLQVLFANQSFGPPLLAQIQACLADRVEQNNKRLAASFGPVAAKVSIPTGSSSSCWL